MLMLRKDHDSWKRVEGLMDHWEAWKQIPQVASEEYRISYIVVIPKQIYLCRSLFGKLYYETFLTPMH